VEKNRWFAIACLALICVLAGLLLMRPSHPGLVYKGKTVEDWSLQLYISQDESGRNAASAALKELGPKAIPDVSRMLRRKDPPGVVDGPEVAGALPPRNCLECKSSSRGIGSYCGNASSCGDRA
jgi:hypothetical protein